MNHTTKISVSAELKDLPLSDEIVTVKETGQTYRYMCVPPEDRVPDGAVKTPVQWWWWVPVTVVETRADLVRAHPEEGTLFYVKNVNETWEYVGDP